MDYGKTLNLPETEFPMRGNLPTREPETLKKWEENDLYGGLMAKNAEKPLFILHDGPPYANGDMHMGHALNKTLKDIIVRYKNMSGYRAPYIHGWDTHGLPIERQAIKKLGINRSEVSVSAFREECKKFALGYVENQKGQIRRLGSLGDYDNSYLTLAPEFEAKQIEIFGEMAKKGYIYKGLKPIYWCPDCETALAEAEIEYEEDKTNSIYVKFRVAEDKGLFKEIGAPVYFVIWTTTTWTLPGNVAIAVNPDFTYSLVRAGEEVYVIAEELVENVMRVGGISDYEKIGEYKGSDLEYIKCDHPFMDRTSLVIVGDHVTLDAGTGCVHTAPGHGGEDYVACRPYKEIPILVPVDAKGYLNELAGEFCGLHYSKANPAIEEKLREVKALYAIEEIIHQYPHCWRCHEPIVFRATEQWFASVDSIKEAACEAIHKVRWIPGWGEERITSMVMDRTDWCISRQRTWGVPIPIFYCKDCGEALITDESIRAVAALFKEKGSGAWYEIPAEEILPKGAACAKCGCTEFTKENDIMDVWFDSGSSHAGVLDVKEGLRFPADLYLEGNDQYRGWFQSSLLTSIAARGEAPYKSVITHGMIVDSDGQKMSKSKGNGVSPQDIIKDFGADILRLWVVSADFKTDMRISKEILKQMSEVYRKIRNTARYILGNIHDFDPKKDSVAIENMNELDKWAMMRLSQMTEKVLAAYESYDFHLIYHAIHNFCVVDMSNFYLDIIKDRLYVEKAESMQRRAAQTVMHTVLDTIVRLLAPVLVYTSEEIWQFMPHRDGDDERSVLYNDMPAFDTKFDSAFGEKWDRFIKVRADVSKALEIARAEKKIGNSVGACVELYVSAEMKAFLESFGDTLSTLFIVSGVKLLEKDAPEGAYSGETEGLKVSIVAPEGEKCERCWLYSTTVGSDADHPTLCSRCAEIIKE